MQDYNGRKLHFQENLCEVFSKDKKQHHCECGDLVLGRKMCCSWSLAQLFYTCANKLFFWLTEMSV